MVRSIVCLLSILSLSTTLWAADNDRQDPYAGVEKLVLDNGLQVYLAPSNEATLVSIRLDVGVGWNAETHDNWGTAHLLEHVLFRDKQLKDEMSYLQLITEAGGDANGSTTSTTTSYFGSIPAKKGLWLAEKFAKMLIEPSFTEDYVNKEKGTIELERGRPDPITQTLGFNPKDYFYPPYLRAPSFWETEFNVSFDDPFTLSQEQLSTQRLTLSQVKTFHNDYYYPSNMRLFIAGKFNRDEMLNFVNSTWAKIPKHEGKTQLAAQPAQPSNKPYVRAQITEGTPYVYVGTKVSGLSVQDEEVLASYMQYLAHRLMKEIRNLKGQTYTASGTTSVYRRYGYSIVEFQTSKENLDDNIALVNSYLAREAEKDGLSDEQVKEAIDLYLSKIDLMGREAGSMMWVAQDRARVEQDYGTFVSPYQTLADVTPAAYNAVLKKYFVPKARYEYIYRPALFFAYDYYFVYLATAIFTFFTLRKLLTKKFDHTKIRWVRKLKYPPVFLLETATVIFAWFLYTHYQFAVTMLANKTAFVQSHITFSMYAVSFLCVVGFLAITQGLLSLLPKKLMIEDQSLVIKSVSYYSRRIPLSEISAVETVRGLTFAFSPKLWLKVGLRSFYFNPQIWKPGLLVTLKDGRGYFFSVRNSREARDELQAYLKVDCPLVRLVERKAA